MDVVRILDGMDCDYISEFSLCPQCRCVQTLSNIVKVEIFPSLHTL